VPGKEPMPAPDARTVLVTGASSGIGRAIVERLAAAGWTVFAAARKPRDLESLAAVPGITPLRLDVRDPAQVAAAVDRVREAGRGLDALVNNAGLGGIGPIAAFTDAELRDLFEVNVFGVFRMTREFLPLILPVRGRIVTIGSQAGSIAMRWYAPYTMSKHAMEAFTRVLDEEIRPHGARASIVQPGAVSTAIGENSIAGDRARFERAPAPFDAEAREILPALDAPITFNPSRPEGPGNRNPCPPDHVAQVVQAILDASDPPLRALVGTRWEGNRVLTTLIDRIADANECPSLRYPAEELAARLRERLDRRPPGNPEVPTS
jgi:NAD(P)-dependent dehydrogenase (short-subunit alcohol dehydrogenase family)